MLAKTLESERLRFEPLGLEHLSQNYVNWMNDPDIIMFLESGGNYDINKLRDFLKNNQEKNILFWAIIIKENNKHIGNIKIDPIDHINQSGEYGILIGDKTEWGKGFAKETSVKIIDYCFKSLKLSKITLGVVSANKRALKTYLKLGFSIVSIINNSGVYNNELCNTIRMEKINDF